MISTRFPRDNGEPIKSGGDQRVSRGSSVCFSQINRTCRSAVMKGVPLCALPARKRKQAGPSPPVHRQEQQRLR